MPHPLYTVDVFAEARLEGNPLAVVLDAGDLATDAMQAIAREMNYSETTFVTGPPEDGAWPVRIFTPAHELPFAGHPTLGTAWVIREHLSKVAPDEVTLALGVGRVPVRFDEGGARAWLTAPPITLHETFEPGRVVPALGLDAGDLHPGAPIQLVDAGIRFVFVPLAKRDALRRMRLDVARLESLRSEGLPVAIYGLCPEAVDPANQLSVRLLFDDGSGVREDPATGSAASCLGAYLLEHELVGPGPLDLRVEQGAEVRRPSLLHLRARATADGREIRVGGGVIPATEGRLLA